MVLKVALITFLNVCQTWGLYVRNDRSVKSKTSLSPNETEGRRSSCQSRPVTTVWCLEEEWEALAPCVGLNFQRSDLFPPKAATALPDEFCQWECKTMGLEEHLNGNVRCIAVGMQWNLWQKLDISASSIIAITKRQGLIGLFLQD